MKKTASALLVATLLFSISVPVFAQKSRLAGGRIILSESGVQFERVDAVTEGRGVLVRWSTFEETNGLGFNVLRVDRNGQTQVNEGLITGLAFKLQAHAHGGQYQVFDAEGDLTSSYVIQSLFQDGRTTLSDAISPRYASDLEAEVGRSAASYENGVKTKNGKLQKITPMLPDDLQQIVQAATPEAELSVHRWVVSQPCAKIGVRKEGFYRVTRAQLQAAGFEVNASSVNWRLFFEGVEQAIIVGAGDQYIEFYGKSIDTPESDTRMYYLLADQNPGMRIQPKLLTSLGGTVVAKNYRATVEMKERTRYNSSVKNGPAENYWGRPITSTAPTIGQQIPINLTGVDTSAAKAVMTVKLQGILGSTHLVRAIINGHQVGFIAGTGNASYSAELLVPTSFLVEGINLLALSEAQSTQSSYFDSVQVQFARKYRSDASDNQMSENRANFFTTGYRKVNLTSFTGPNVRVFDTTFPGIPQEVINTPAQLEPGDGSFTVKIPSHRPMVMYAAENSAFLNPASVTFNNGSTLADRNNQSDVLIIAHSSFMAEAQAWANYRNSAAGGGYNSKVVDVADVFDEFNYGVLSSKAINDFLIAVMDTWQSPKPQYLLLLGDSSYDSRNYEGNGMFNLVPTRFVSMLFEETGSDEALGDINPHDGVSEIPIGRIPARSGLAITNALNKTIAFELPGTTSLDRGALFAYDCPNGFDFEGMSIGLRSELPQGTSFLMVPRCMDATPTPTPDPQAHDNLIAGLNTGKFLVNYAGHGTPGIWASTTYFSTPDTLLLTNNAHQSVFTMLTCYNGVFFRPEPNNDSISESLLKVSGGAVATWASTTETTTDYQFPMGARFYGQVGAGNLKRLGDLIKDAKFVIAGSDVGYSWVLLGDPALKMKQ